MGSRAWLQISSTWGEYNSARVVKAYDYASPIGAPGDTLPLWEQIKVDPTNYPTYHPAQPRQLNWDWTWSVTKTGTAGQDLRCSITNGPSVIRWKFNDQ